MPKKSSRLQTPRTKQTNKTAPARSKSTDSQRNARRIEAPTYKSFRLSKRIKQPKPRLLGSFRLLKQTFGVLFKNWKLFGGITLVYVLLTLTLVKGFGVTSSLGELKTTLEELFAGSTAQVATSLALFGILLSNSNAGAGEAASAYQGMLLITISLVVIWALRHVAANKTAPKLRDAFYSGLYPTVPFVLILIVVGLQLIPLLIGNFLYGVVFGTGLAVTSLEKVLWILFIVSLVLLSLYMITSSVFALYIVTLPQVTPMAALRSARGLVRHRRMVVMRKLLFLPIALLVLAAVLVVPFIVLSPPIAEWVFFVISMAGLVLTHGYIYGLYRELIQHG